MNHFLFLTYHRVLPKGMEKRIQRGMYVEQETFESHIKFLKNLFKIISPPGLLFINRKSYTKNSKPLCVLTFDDGWYDFYKNAFPILKAFQVPATVFLPTDFVGTNKWFWTDRLTMLFSQWERAESKGHRAKSRKQRLESKEHGDHNNEPLESANAVVNKIENLKGSYETRMERAIQLLKIYRKDEIEQILAELFRRWSINPNPLERSFLSWGEVREMAASGLITFGSHTASHRILTTLTDDEIQDELVRSKERLISEQVVDPSFIPFCYPNGDYNEKIVRMVKEAGYSLAVTTEYGWNSFGADLFTLKRIGIHQDISSTEAMFACRVAGIF